MAISNIKTSGNPWAGITIATRGQFAPLGTSGIVFTGTNSFGEVGIDNGGLQLEAANFNVPLSPIPITWSTNIADGAMVTIQASDFGYALGGPQNPELINPGHGAVDPDAVLYATLPQCSAAAGSPDHFCAASLYPHHQ